MYIYIYVYHIIGSNATINHGGFCCHIKTWEIAQTQVVHEICSALGKSWWRRKETRGTEADLRKWWWMWMSKNSGRKPHISLEFIGFQETTISIKIDRSSKWLGRSVSFPLVGCGLVPRNVHQPLFLNEVNKISKFWCSQIWKHHIWTWELFDCSDLHFVVGMKEEEPRTDALHKIVPVLLEVLKSDSRYLDILCNYTGYIMLVDWK